MFVFVVKNEKKIISTQTTLERLLYADMLGIFPRTDFLVCANLWTRMCLPTSVSFPVRV